jgi:hypothetical protein
VIGELHTKINKVQRNLRLAGEAGLPYEAYLHRSHLEELMDTAMRYGIDVRPWVDRSLLPPLALVEA